MNFAPLVLFTYRRLPRETIESLLSNDVAKETDLYIFSDGYRSNIDKRDVLNVREYLKSISGFKSIIINEYDSNKGLAVSIISGVTATLTKFRKVIVLEDDLIVASNFLDFMNDSLDFYENDNRIWSISGYSPNFSIPENYKSDIFLSVRGSSWGWATWKGRWDSIDWQVKNFESIKNNKQTIEDFEQGGNDLFKMLELQMLGRIDSWAVRWCFSQFIQNRYTIYPVKSKTINNGFSDEKAVHNNGQSWRKFDVTLNNKKVRLEKGIIINAAILNEFRKINNIGLYTKVGYFLKKFGGYQFAKKTTKLCSSFFKIILFKNK